MINSSFISILKEDFYLNSFRSFLILLFYRILHKVHRYKILFFIVSIIFFILKVAFQINSQISYKANIGRRIKLPHIGFGVVISSKAKIGNDVVIFHLVTIGINEKKCNRKDNICVEIGNNCLLATGCKIINAKVGDNCRVGANAVVYKNVPDNSIIMNKVLIN